MINAAVKFIAGLFLVAVIALSAYAAAVPPAHRADFLVASYDRYAAQVAAAHPTAPPAMLPQPADGWTPTTWAWGLLNRLGDPPTPASIRAIVSWEMAEGGHWGNTAHYNPLNTTQPEPGSRPMNSVGVQSYTSWDQGYAATVTTLRNGRYGGILAALRDGTCSACVAAAVGASPWGTGRFAIV